MMLFRHGGKTSSSPPPLGELTVVVVAVALRGLEAAKPFLRQLSSFATG